jgi:hypothetical protein
MGFTSRNFVLAKTRDHLYWIFRRANAGFLSGAIAWFFIPALSRVISQESTAILHFCIQGLLGGAFLGTVDGMVEESTPKTVRGAWMGGLGGMIGGTIFGYFSPNLGPEQIAWGIFLMWASAGTFIGLVSALWERKIKKSVFGALSGFAGGGIGGALGYAVYAYLVEEFNPHSWVVRRLCEGFSGGIIGVTMWFSIGIAERFVVFTRKVLEGKSVKTCHYCSQQNPLSSWYCGSCGSVLQEAALPGQLNLPPFATLDRVREMFRFLSRLAVTTGFIAGLVIFIVFIPVNKMLALVALVIVGIVVYCLMIVFSSLSESIQVFTKRT